MPVNHEVKGNLARLLATEDLVVEHKKVQTACFNVHTRVLTLPMWEKASNGVYDLLVGHEVGHALFTPDEDWTETVKVPPQFVNIVEDARVEKLMKRKYAGLAKTFYNGYKELNEDDFFQIADDDISTFNLADKVNLFYKIGNYINVPFTEEEMAIVRIIGGCEDFKEVLFAAEVLYKYCKKNQEEEQKIASLNSHPNVNSGNSGEPGENQEHEEGDNNSDDVQSNQGQSSTQNQDDNTNNEDANTSGQMNNTGGFTSDIEVKTADALEKSINELVNNIGYENVYIELPKLNLDTVVIDNKKIHDECDRSWKSTIEIDEKPDAFVLVDKKYSDFKRSAQKEVNYLVKEFECKKSADSYSRATTSRTGILDCSKLHTYKYNEDLFKKVTTLANGKNHGLVFIVDWSGSMSDVLLDTVKQLYNLIWFCKKVNIPFEVYAFTNEWRRVSYDDMGKVLIPKPHYDKKQGLVFVDESFSLLNIITSKVSGAVLEHQMKNMFRVAYNLDRTNYYGYSNNYSIPYGLMLSGTPLNQTLIALHQILPKFKTENKLQKVQCVILTDGEGEWSKFHMEFNRKWENQPYLGLNSISNNTVLRDRKTGMVYKMSEDNNDFTDILLRNLKDKFVDVNFIGIRIVESRNASNFIRKYTGFSNTEYVKMMSEWKKNRNISIKTSGYTRYFGLSATALNTSTDFKVDEDATKGQIKSAFTKSLTSKKMNKKILNEFVSLIS